MEQFVETAMGMWARKEWLFLAALLVGLAVRVVKDQQFKLVFLPVRYRAPLAVALGIAAGFMVALGTGAPVSVAVAGGLSAGFAAVGGHKVLVEGLFGGKELPLPWLPGISDREKKEPPPGSNGAVPPGMFMLLVLAGCLPPEADHALQVITQAVPKVESALLDAYELQILHCRVIADGDNAVEAPCVASVEASWKPVIDVLEEVRRVWCDLNPTAEGC